MQIRAGYEVKFDVLQPLSMLLMLYTYPSRANTVEGEELSVTPSVPVEEFFDSFGNRCGRITVTPGPLALTADFMVQDTGEVDEANPAAEQWPIERVPADILPFLLPSRYCEVDLLNDIAWNLFGQTPKGWTRVDRICDWVHAHVTFGYEFARSTKTAWDVYNERQGVCRDFTHLAITLCRAMNIPARYATGYLGDIGVPVSPNPMDFSAWFEVFLDGRWYTRDARHNDRRIGRILMARGRDAVDVAITTSFGAANLTGFKVWTDEVK